MSLPASPGRPDRPSHSVPAAQDAALAADVDPDLDEPARPGSPQPQWPVIAAIAIGGVLGAEGRYGLASALPHPSSAFAWSTVVINLTGCFALGVLMAILHSRSAPHRLLRPFIGVGVLGGYTTYSTFAVDVQRLVLADRPWTALAYLLITVLGGALAVWLATRLTEAVIATRPMPDPVRPTGGRA